MILVLIIPAAAIPAGPPKRSDRSPSTAALRGAAKALIAVSNSALARGFVVLSAVPQGRVRAAGAWGGGGGSPAVRVCTSTLRRVRYSMTPWPRADWSLRVRGPVWGGTAAARAASTALALAIANVAGSSSLA